MIATTLAMLKKSPNTITRIDVYPGVSFKGIDALCEAARVLVERGGPFVLAESATLGAAWTFLKERPVSTGLDVIVAQTCSKFGQRVPTTPKHIGPTPFDDAIATAEAECAQLKEAEQNGRAAWQRIDDEITEARRRGKDTARLKERKTAAMDAWHETERSWLRVRARLTALENSRSAWLIDRL